MKTRLKLFLQWGIRFDKKPYEIPEQSARKVHYADKRELETAIITRYPPAAPDPVEYREELGDVRVRRGARSRSPKTKKRLTDQI